MLHRILIFALCTSLPAAAYELRVDSAGDVVRWKKPLELVIDEASITAWGVPNAVEAIQEAIATVKKATPGLEVSARVGKAKAIGFDLNSPATNQNDVVVLTDWPYMGDALAVTLVTVNARTDEIIDADIAFNATGRPFAVIPKDKAMTSVDDVQNTFTHELGHALGLMHNKEDRRVVMYPGSTPGEVSKRVLATDDEQALLALYDAPAVSPDTAPMQAAGCSSTSESSITALLLIGVVLLFARRPAAALARPRRSSRHFGVTLALVGATATGTAQAQSLEGASAVAIAKVSATSVQFINGRVFTTLTITTTECLKGRCASYTRIQVPGGKVGDIEQAIIEHPVPTIDESLLMALDSQAKPRILPLREPVAKAAAIEMLKNAKLALPESLKTSDGSKAPQAPTRTISSHVANPLAGQLK